MDSGTITSIAMVLILGGIIGGALVGWYLRSLGWPKPVVPPYDPSDSAGA